MAVSLDIPGLKSTLFSRPLSTKKTNVNEIRSMKSKEVRYAYRHFQKNGRSAAIWLLPKLMAFCERHQYKCAAVNLETRAAGMVGVRRTVQRCVVYGTTARFG